MDNAGNNQGKVLIEGENMAEMKNSDRDAALGVECQIKVPDNFGAMVVVFGREVVFTISVGNYGAGWLAKKIAVRATSSTNLRGKKEKLDTFLKNAIDRGMIQEEADRLR
jgi:hypothetical protein